MEGDRNDRVEQLELHVARLDEEVARLRSRLGEAESLITPIDAPTRPTATTDRSPWPAPRPITALPTQTARATPVRMPVRVDSETVLKWGGVGLVVLAVGFAVSTAISRDWIGPEMQLAGALLVSAAFIGAGLRLRPTRPAWTHALCSGGVLAFFTTFASDLFLDRANETIAFAATAVIGAGGLALARTIRSEWVAAATLLGGSIGWAVIAGSGDDLRFVTTTVWYVALVGATIALAIERGWFAVRPAAHAIGMISLLALSGEVSGNGESTLLAVATVMVAGSLFVVPSIGALTSRWQQVEVELAAATAPWAFAVALAAFLDDRSDNTIAITAFAIAALAALAATALEISRPHRVSLVLGASVTVSIGLTVLLSTTFVFVALAVQAAGLILLSRSLGRSIRILINAVVLATIAMANTLVTMFDAWVDNAAWGDDVANALVIVAFAVGIWYFADRDIRRAGAIATLGLFLVWSGSVLVHAPQGQAVVSVAWATVGTVVFLTGAVRKRADAASTGLAVLALTVGKLLTVDLREVDTLWRAGLFFLVGVGLLRLGFLLPRLTRREPEAPDSGRLDDSGELGDQDVPDHLDGRRDDATVGVDP